MKKGFTLIELLAVILILGIIALIAIPTVTSVIEDSKKGSLKTSASNILRAAEQTCQMERIKGTPLTKKYTIADGKSSSDLDIKNMPESGTITVNDECNASVAIVDNGYCATTENEDVVISSNTHNCNAKYGEVAKTKESCFIFDEATKTITGYNFDNASCPLEVSIPATINDVPVEHIGDYAFYNTVADIIIYGANNNTGYDNLDSVKTNLTREDGYSLFTMMPAMLTKTDNPQKTCVTTANVTTKFPINYEFTDEELSKYLYCNPTDAKRAKLYGKLTKLNLSSATNLKSIGEGAFLSNSITNVIFGNNTNYEIGVSAFGENLITGVLDLSNTSFTSIKGFDNNSITKVILPDTLEEIYPGAFYNNQISDIYYGKNIKNIGFNSLKANKLSGNITIPDGITIVNSFAYSNNDITSVTLNDDVTKICDSAFSNNSIVKINFNDKITSIGIGSFAENDVTIDSLVLPNNITSIGDYAFYETKIKNLTISDNITRIPYASFASCLIENITWGKLEKLVSIGESAFYDNKIKNFTLPNGLNTINTQAFLYAITDVTNEEIIIPDTVSSIGTYALAFPVGTNLKTVHIGSGIGYMDPKALYCNDSIYCTYEIYIDRENADTMTGYSNKWGNPTATINWKNKA